MSYEDAFGISVYEERRLNALATDEVIDLSTSVMILKYGAT